ncbi:MAG: hypothetical protein LUQ65_11180 [Candidatus Helarchaeota archaeon]|nr:hypothetical protein [Candidatus Helarchaeota archaeon]
MSGPPGGSSDASFLPFVTSITTDIYERIEKIAKSIEDVKTSVNGAITTITDNFNGIVKKIEEMVEQGDMNKNMILESFSDSMNTLVQQIKTIRNENIKTFSGPQTQQLIEAASLTANQLESQFYDIQIAFLVNGIHALITAIKAGKVVGIPVPVGGGAVAAPAAAKHAGEKAELAAPVPTLAAEATEGDKRTFFGKGVRKKTHDEIMEEKKKQEKLYGKYRT